MSIIITGLLTKGKLTDNSHHHFHLKFSSTFDIEEILWKLSNTPEIIWKFINIQQIIGNICTLERETLRKSWVFRNFMWASHFIEMCFVFPSLIFATLASSTFQSNGEFFFSFFVSVTDTNKHNKYFCPNKEILYLDKYDCPHNVFIGGEIFITLCTSNFIIATCNSAMASL